MSELREKIGSILRESWSWDYPEDSGCDFVAQILAAFKAHIEKYEMPEMGHILSMGYDADPYQCGRDCAHLAISADRRALMESLE